MQFYTIRTQAMY